MPKLEHDERQLLADYDAGWLVSGASPAELQRLREAARATAVRVLMTVGRVPQSQSGGDWALV